MSECCRKDLVLQVIWAFSDLKTSFESSILEDVTSASATSGKRSFKSCTRTREAHKRRTSLFSLYMGERLQTFATCILGAVLAVARGRSDIEMSKPLSQITRGRGCVQWLFNNATLPPMNTIILKCLPKSAPSLASLSPSSFSGTPYGHFRSDSTHQMRYYLAEPWTLRTLFVESSGDLDIRHNVFCCLRHISSLFLREPNSALALRPKR